MSKASEHRITVSPTFYRYDLQLPPDEWSTEFFNSEPQYYDPVHGHKNQAGLFFFTDSRDIAHDLGKKAAQKQKQDYYYLTTTVATAPLDLIDISRYTNAYKMIEGLASLGIDVLIPDLKTFEGENHFGQLKHPFETAASETDKYRKIALIKQVTLHTNPDGSDASLFGQRLTDFSNGKVFKELVRSSIEQSDGYLFTEFGDNRGSTYSLFKSRKLSKLEREKITLNTAKS